MDQDKIGSFIQVLRKNKGLTQKELSQMLDISDKTVSKWETGHGLPDTYLLIKLCQILEVNVSELLSGEKLSPEIYSERTENTIVTLLKEKEKIKRNQWIQIMIGVFLLVFAIYFAIMSNGLSANAEWYLNIPTLAVLLLVSVSCGLVASFRNKGKFVYALQQVVLPVGAIIGMYQLMNALIFYDSALALITCLVNCIQPILYALIFYVGLMLIKVYNNF